MTPSPPRRVAVVGSGVAGLTAAHVLTRDGASVTLFEADTRLGGHADTHTVDTPDGPVEIDTGFIVHNERTYPVLLGLFDELGVATQDSEMSMSVRCDATGIEYAGALGLRGLFPTWRSLLRPAYLRLLTEIPRFHRRARRLLATPGDDQTLRTFVDDAGFSPLFRTHFLESLVACVWSCDPAVALDYPARYLFRFLDHHGMLGVFGSPQWRTVTGGSRTYVERVAARLDAVLTGTPVTALVETADGVEVTDGHGVVRRFDAAVVATHPDQALRLLAAPTPLQREVLGAMPYSANTAQLHTDTSLLPRAARARASWNYLRRPGPVTVTYDLTRLMRLRPDWAAPGGTRHLVTLGGGDLVDPATVIATRHYAHPLYTPASVAAQARLPEIDTDRIAFAGAYHGWGFHEDGARSGLAAAERLGATRLRPATLAPPEAAVYETTVRHTRRRPFRRTFTHRTHTWLVDLDHLPRHRLGVLTGTFEARDHLGDPDRSLRENVAAFLAGHGLDLPAAADGGRVLMAAHARAFGYCFNPISVFWCFAGESLLGVVVEVHNTYGERHAYLVHPDAQGRARTDKAMYVSPFHGTDGWYDVAVPVPGADGGLRVAVALHTDDGAVFSASLTGRRSTARPLRAAPEAARASLLIRMHGIALFLRRLEIRSRPRHEAQVNVQRPAAVVPDPTPHLDVKEPAR
jgi:predicted NAD/FAD-binding protein